MHIRTKFDGGKQIDQSQRDSWQRRCAGAVLRMNEGPEWGPQQWAKIVGLPAGSVYTASSAKARETLAKKVYNEGENQEENAKDQTTLFSLGLTIQDNIYDNGPNAMDVPSDIPPKDMHNLMVSYYSANIKITEVTATKLSIDTADQGESVLWYEERSERLTASNVGKIAKRRATTKVGPTVQQFLHTKLHGNVATSWGNFQEEDSNRKYCLPLEKE